MNFALHFTKRHKYRVSVFSQRINETESDNPSQGAEATAYLVIGEAKGTAPFCLLSMFLVEG
jgi:hypothetical protein